MTRRYFGTDGIRGTANSGKMTPEIALKLGIAAGCYFKDGQHRHKVIIGKDTRLSGYMIEPALTAGFISAGMDVVLVGPMPTPAIAMLTRSMRADIGVMISASHNSFEDNGIKLFNSEGLKLSDEIELKIEQMMDSELNDCRVEPENLGRAKRLENVRGRYIEHVKSSFPKAKTLSGKKIVIDSANGAAYHVAPTVFYELGAEVISIGSSPDGFNINKDCGSTYPENLCKRVVEEKADFGIALDGDADRVIICDENGHVIDGDQLMAVIATYWQSKNRLKNNGIVATVMSNMGLEKYLAEHDIHLHRTQVGDRYVSEFMRESGHNVGGEQSGHIILSGYATTGDGILAALQFAAVMCEKNKKASELAHVFEPFPQVLKNFRYQDGQNPDEIIASSQSEIDNAEKELGKNGRVLIRKSGTEPLIRVMIEGKDSEKIDNLSENILKRLSA